MQTLLVSVESLEPTRSAEEINAVRTLFKRLSLLSSAKRITNRLLEQHVSAFWMVWNTIEQSNLVATATENELADAQHFMPSIVTFNDVLDNPSPLFVTKEPPHWTPLQAETIGAAFFGITLALLKAGYQPQLKLTSQHLDNFCASTQDEKQLEKTAREIRRLWSFNIR